MEGTNEAAWAAHLANGTEIDSESRCLSGAGPVRREVLKGISGTPNSSTAGAVENASVNHCLQVFVAKEVLDRPDIISVFDQVRREGVAKGLTGSLRRTPASRTACLTAR